MKMKLPSLPVRTNPLLEFAINKGDAKSVKNMLDNEGIVPSSSNLCDAVLGLHQNENPKDIMKIIGYIAEAIAERTHPRFAAQELASIYADVKNDIQLPPTIRDRATSRIQRARKLVPQKPVSVSLGTAVPQHIM
jgi:hypothetical protein